MKNFKKKYSTKRQKEFRNKNIPIDIKKLARAKLPRLIDISSNALEHLIIETIKQKVMIQNSPNKEGIEKLISEIIALYTAIYKRNLEYEQLYDLKIDIIIDKEIDYIHKTTHEIIAEIININKNSGKEEPIIPQELSDLLNNIRNNIIKENKDKWIMIEIVMEKISHLQKLNYTKHVIKHP